MKLAKPSVENQESVCEPILDGYRFNYQNFVMSHHGKRSFFVRSPFTIKVSSVQTGIVYWEIDVVHKPECSGFEAFELVLTSMARNEKYRLWVILWFRNVAHVFLPIILLIVLNGAIIFKFSQHPDSTRRKLTRQSIGNCAEDESMLTRRKNVKAATRMLLVLVATYLLANLLSFVISIWENVNQSYLFENQVFYTFATDLITLSTVLTGFLRLPIYYSCNNQIKLEIHGLLKKFSYGKSKNDNYCWNNLATVYKPSTALKVDSQKRIPENEWILTDCQVQEKDVPWEFTEENGKLKI
uniref:G-protein coupled receptors family 1 profile domain-containing protein n=1 Tax=Romanomermis culicivorax TaxID=13658 RepID=A0A915JR63_ROMCU